MVSDHPEGRFGASGPLADARSLDDVPWDDYYGPGSPLERFVRAGGRVLRLGADLDTVTLLHYAEYLAPLPDKRRVRRHRLVSRPATAASCAWSSASTTATGSSTVPGEDYFAVILREYLATGQRRDRDRRRRRRASSSTRADLVELRRRLDGRAPRDGLTHCRRALSAKPRLRPSP